MPRMADIQKALKHKSMWIVCTIAFLFFGTVFTFTGNLSKGLVGGAQYDYGDGRAILSLLTFGCIIITSISDKGEARKPFICAGTMISLMYALVIQFSNIGGLGACGISCPYPAYYTLESLFRKLSKVN